MLPVLQVALTSVWDGTHFTSEQFERAFGDSLYVRILLRTVGVSLTATFWCLLIGYPAAYHLARLPAVPRRRRLFFILLPLWMSVLVRSFAWMAVLGRQGPLNALLLTLGLVDQPLQMLFTSFSVTLAMVQILLPFTVLTCLNAMLAIDPGLIRAARIHGASPWRAFLSVFLPLSAPGIAAASVLVAILAMGFFITPLLLGGPRNQMLGNLIVGQIADTVNWGFAAALAVLLFAATVLLIGLLRGAVGRGMGAL
jgi:putative spermidine/putrescine transport system permease protein